MFTRQGDKGETGLYGSTRVPKDSPRVEAYGAIDELNSCIGLAASYNESVELKDLLREVQMLLFVAGADMAAELPTDDKEDRVPRIGKQDTRRFETASEELYRTLPRLQNFVLPGGAHAAAQLHVARAVCRRAERRIVAASRKERINPEMLPFFNRLSTYLFNLARYANSAEGRTEEVWKK